MIKIIFATKLATNFDQLVFIEYCLPMSTNDPRRSVGSRVSTKAIRVTAEAECARRYGANSKTKEIFGTVVEVLNQKTAGGRNSTSIVGDFDLGGGTMKRATINLSLIHI